MRQVLAFLSLCALIGCGDSGTTSDAAPLTGNPDAAAPDAGAAAKTFTVALTPAGEPNPCAGAAAGATGSATVTISADGAQIQVANLTFSGLSGSASAAHIHFGSATTPSGPVVLSFGSSPTSPLNKTFSAADYVAANGAPASFADFVTAARAGNAAYINVHTAACPGGEIRGELK